jgi:uncharacterized membrane protein
VIGIIWVNHHAVIDHLRRVNRPLLFLNLLLLLSVAFLPFPTALLAEHLDSGADEEVAAAVYAGANALMGIAFAVLWTYIIRHRELLGVELSDEEIRSRTFWFTIGNPFYLVSIAVAFISPEAVRLITGLVALYYAIIAGGMRSPETSR